MKTLPDRKTNKALYEVLCNIFQVGEEVFVKKCHLSLLPLANPSPKRPFEKIAANM